VATLPAESVAPVVEPAREIVTETAVPEATTGSTVEIDRTSPVETAAVEDVAPVEASPAPAPSRQRGRRIHTMEEFVELWPAVLARVRKKIGVTAVAYLHDALPVELTETDAVLQFKKEFHYEKAREAAKRLPFEQVLNECMAAPHLLKFRLAEPPKKQIVAKEAAPEISAHDDEEIEDDVLKYAQNIFAAEIVGRSGEG
jgi:hypothetical protein